MNLPPYALVTPARNEAEFIERTIQSVVKQSVLPVKWVIVSDGSTDGTDEIVKAYAAEHPWIELLRMPERRERHFAGKAHAFNAGYALLRGFDYEAIGSLDGDLSFDEEYFAFLLRKLVDDPKLGLVGTPFRGLRGGMYDYRFVSLDHVSGACQLFRRECFEAVGGYVPMKGGGVDHVAVITARMRGWKTRTFTEKFCLHYREMGSALHTPMKARFRTGALDYALGGHPLWEIFRSVYQSGKPPYVVGGLTLLSGYIWAMARRQERPVSNELVRFRRREQMQRLRKYLSGGRASASSSVEVSS